MAGKTRKKTGGLSLDKAARILARGGVIAYPTETYFALGAGLDYPEAMARVATIKRRPQAKPLPLIIGEEAQMALVLAPRYAAGPVRDDFETLIGLFWPGPLSLVVPAGPFVPPACRDAVGLTSVRLTSHPVARELCLRAAMPLTATSANISGSPPARLAAEIDPGLDLDGVLELGEKPAGGPASTVAVPVGEGRLIVLRLGAIPLDQLKAAGFGGVIPDGSNF